MKIQDGRHHVQDLAKMTHTAIRVHFFSWEHHYSLTGLSEHSKKVIFDIDSLNHLIMGVIFIIAGQEFE